MIVYRWYDHRAENRDQPVLDGLNELAKIFDAFKIDGDSSDLDDHTLAFIHAGTGQGESEENWKNEVRCGQERYVVFVSSRLWSSSSNSNSNEAGIYHITQPLPTIAKYLSDNPGKIDSFKQSCEKGAPDWSVFEPVIYPENLVAYYLALVAGIEPPSGLETEANKNYEELAKAHGPVEGTFGQDGIKKLFEKMATAI